MSLWKRPQRGHTLVELGFVTMIIAILANLGIPELIQFILRARRAEIYPNLNGIITSQLAYESAHDSFVSEPRFVPSGCTARARAWVHGTNFDALGFALGDKVFAGYTTGYDEDCGVWAQAQMDLDGDGEILIITTYHGNQMEYARTTDCRRVAIPPTRGGGCSTGLELVSPYEEM